jgi:hypothetical protein
VFSQPPSKSLDAAAAVVTLRVKHENGGGAHEATEVHNIDPLPKRRVVARPPRLARTNSARGRPGHRSVSSPASRSRTHRASSRCVARGSGEVRGYRAAGPGETSAAAPRRTGPTSHSAAFDLEQGFRSDSELRRARDDADRMGRRRVRVDPVGDDSEPIWCLARTRAWPRSTISSAEGLEVPEGGV